MRRQLIFEEIGIDRVIYAGRTAPLARVAIGVEGDQDRIGEDFMEPLRPCIRGGGVASGAHDDDRCGLDRGDLVGGAGERVLCDVREELTKSSDFNLQRIQVFWRKPRIQSHI